MNTNKKIVNIALIGFGKWGKNYFKTIKDISEINLKYIYSKNKKQEMGISLINNYEVIISDPKVDAVIIATPQKTHYNFAKKALLHKKDVLLEKPMANNSKECLDLIRIAKENKKILMMGHIFLYHPAIIKIKDIIKSGFIGKVVSIQSTRSSFSKEIADKNVIWHLAPHDISIANFLLDELPKVIGANGFKVSNRGPYETANIALKYPTEIHVNIHISYKEYKKIRKIIITGTKKIIIFDDMDIDKVKIFDFENLKNFKKIKIDPIAPLKSQCDHFVECIKKRGIPKTSGIDGYINTKILEEVEKVINKF